MTDPNGSSTPLQIIDVDCKLNDDALQELSTAMSSFDGTNYSVLSVIGCQSSGKSSLLNQMFDVNFEVLSDKHCGSQTTKGVWVSPRQQYNTVILDVEGTDSIERGEFRESVEHRSSLLIFAISDVIILNMWYSDIGRHSASNYDLLRTIFQITLDLYQKSTVSNKTKLIVTIRDWHIKLASEEDLRAKLLSDFKNLWKEANSEERREFEDYYEFDVFTLPCKLSCPEDFAEKCIELRKSVFAKPREYSRSVPADGFAYYFSSVWQSILELDEFDIPSKQKLVSQHRCATLASNTISEIIDSISNAKQSGICSAEFFHEILCTNFASFQTATSKYDPKIAKENLLSNCRVLEAWFQSSNCVETAEFVNEVIEKVHQRTESSLNAIRTLINGGRDINSVLQAITDSYNSYSKEYDTAIDSAKAFCHDWRFVLQDFKIECINEETFLSNVQSQLATAKEQFKAKLVEILSTVEEQSAEQMLDSIFEKIRSDTVLETVIPHEFISHFKSIVEARKLIDNTPESELFSHMLEILRRKSRCYPSVLLNALVGHFSEKFNQVANGLNVALAFSSEASLMKHFNCVKNQTFSRLDQALHISINPSVFNRKDSNSDDASPMTSEDEVNILNFESSKLIILKNELATQINRIGDQSLTVFRANTRQSGIPIYFWILLFILGFNEAKMVLRNPVILLLLIFAGTMAFLFHSTGLSVFFKDKLKKYLLTLQTSLVQDITN